MPHITYLQARCGADFQKPQSLVPQRDSEHALIACMVDSLATCTMLWSMASPAHKLTQQTAYFAAYQHIVRPQRRE